MAEDTTKVQPEYNAASNGRRLKIWRQPHTGPNTVTAGSLQTIRNRSRGAVRNDPWAGTASDKLVSNMIGTGIQAKTRNGSKEFKAAVKELWDRWVKQSDADQVFDFYGQQALAAREWHEAGEVFIRLRRRRASDGLPVPLQVQLIEAEQCPADYWTTGPNGNEIKAGIEFDKIGRRVAYWMYRAHPGDLNMTVDSTQLVRVPADEVLHVYEPLRAGQLRGLPPATSALIRMMNVDKFDDAVLERQHVANLFAGFYVTSGTEDPEPGAVSTLQTDTDTDDTPLAGLEPGTMQEVPPGMKPEFSDPPDAGSNYADYLRAQLLAIAARHGVPYEVLTGDLRDVSDRALRLILNEFRRLIEQRQWLVLIPKFCQPIREAWWDAAVLAGALVAPGYAERREEYTDTLWVPQGWPYSHPVQDVDADLKAIKGGLTSRTARILSNGDDPEEVDAENAEDSRREAEHGLEYGSDGRAAKVGAATEEEDGDDDDEPAGRSSKAQVSAPITVNVAPPAVHVHQAPVHVSAPTVNVAPPAVTVNAPQPQVTVHVPPAQTSPEEVAAMKELTEALRAG